MLLGTFVCITSLTVVADEYLFTLTAALFEQH